MALTPIHPDIHFVKFEEIHITTAHKTLIYQNQPSC